MHNADRVLINHSLGSFISSILLIFVQKFVRIVLTYSTITLVLLDTSSSGSPPAKKKPDDKDSSTEDVFESEAAKSPTENEANGHEPEPIVDDPNGPDLTCSEQLPTNCASPDPYSGEFPAGERFYRNGVENASTGNGAKEKESSSSLDEGKVSHSFAPFYFMNILDQVSFVIELNDKLAVIFEVKSTLKC